MPSPIRIVLVIASALLLAGCGSSSSGSSGASSAGASGTAASSSSAGGGSTIGFEGVPIEQVALLASPGTTQTGVVDGIHCGATEQLAYHIHAHLAVYADGQPRVLPGGIGIPSSTVENTTEGPVAIGGQCIYWLHTHAPDGIIHVESPTQRIYTLGNFFDEWHQPLSTDAVGGAQGHVTAYVDGKPWTRSPSQIPIKPHSVIQLDVGSPSVAFHPMSWSGLQL